MSWRTFVAIYACGVVAMIGFFAAPRVYGQIKCGPGQPCVNQGVTAKTSTPTPTVTPTPTLTPTPTVTLTP